MCVCKMMRRDPQSWAESEGKTVEKFGAKSVKCESTRWCHLADTHSIIQTNFVYNSCNSTTKYTEKKLM